MPLNGFNFTERVRRCLAHAREEAARLRHEYVGTEHLLLGLLREGEGVASQVLANLSIEVSALRERLEEAVMKGRRSEITGPDLPYTSRGKKVLELAMTAARELRHAYVGTEHILLGLLAEEKGIAAQVLVAEGLTIDVARAETLRILGTGQSDEESAGRDPATAIRRAFVRAMPGTVGPRRGAVPRQVVVEIQHDDGWTLRRELRSIDEAIQFLIRNRGEE